MSATIKYKGNTIANITETANKTLKTSGKYCEGDIVIENVQDGGIVPTGQIDITENGTFDVTNFASALVNVEGGGSEWKVESGTEVLSASSQNFVISASENINELYAVIVHTYPTNKNASGCQGFVWSTEMQDDTLFGNATSSKDTWCGYYNSNAYLTINGNELLLHAPYTYRQFFAGETYYWRLVYK